MGRLICGLSVDREAIGAAKSVSARGTDEEEVCGGDDRVEYSVWGVS